MSELARLLTRSREAARPSISCARWRPVTTASRLDRSPSASCRKPLCFRHRWRGTQTPPSPRRLSPVTLDATRQFRKRVSPLSELAGGSRRARVLLAKIRCRSSRSARTKLVPAESGRALTERSSASPFVPPVSPQERARLERLGAKPLRLLWRPGPSAGRLSAAADERAAPRPPAVVFAVSGRWTDFSRVTQVNASGTGFAPASNRSSSAATIRWAMGLGPDPNRGWAH